MIGRKAPETCRATHKRQVTNLWNCCILLVDLFESYDDARTNKRQSLQYAQHCMYFVEFHVLLLCSFLLAFLYLVFTNNEVSLISHEALRSFIPYFTKPYEAVCRSQWPRGLRRGCAALRFLEICDRISPGAWMFVSKEHCVLSGRDLCIGLDTRPEESYRVCRVWVWSWTLHNEEALAH